MIRILIFLLIIVSTTSSNNLNAQNTVADSLENLLRLSEKTDTSRINVLNKISNAFRNTYPEKSFTYAKEALELSEKLNYKKGTAQSLLNLGKYYSSVSDYTKAIENYLRSVEISEEINDKRGIAECYNNIGTIYAKQSNYSVTLDYYYKSLKIKEEIDDKWGISASLNNIGVVYNFQENYPKALEYYKKSLKVKQEIDDKKGIAKCLNNIGIIYMNQRNYSLALEYYHQSLKMNQEIGNKLEISNCMQNIGLVYNSQGKDSVALSYFQKSLTIYNELGYTFGISSIKMNIGDIYQNNQNYDKALDYTIQSQEIAEEKGFLSIQKESYLQLSKIYSGLKNYKKAYENHVIYKKLSDSIFNNENTKKITELESRYKYEKEIQRIESEQQKRDLKQKYVRISFITGFVLLSVLVIVIFINLIQKRRTNNLLSQQNEEIHQLNEELSTANAVLHDQNIELEDHKYNLEKIVKERTSDLEIAKEKAEESDRLKTAFLANMSHEIRTPLNAIVGFSNLLTNRELSDEETEGFISNINKNTDALLNLIDDIIDIAKIESGQLGIEKEDISLFELLDELIPIYEEKRNHPDKKDIKFTVQKTQQDIRIHTDPDRLRQILINLVDNAFKFTEKGEIEIGFERTNRNGPNNILFFVKDTGIGISEKEANIIFERFNKTEEDKTKLFRGAGLGLTISKNLVELMGGQIWLESETGKGSKFFFTLPM